MQTDLLKVFHGELTSVIAAASRLKWLRAVTPVIREECGRAQIHHLVKIISVKESKSFLNTGLRDW